MQITTINPTTEKELQSYDIFAEKQIDELIDCGDMAFQKWHKTTFSHRKKLMLNAVKVLQNNKARYAELMAQEMGKPVTLGKAEIEKCAWVCEHYAEQAEMYLAPRTLSTEMRKCLVCYRPLGIIFAIMPWNFPFWQVFRFAAPNLMAGNTAILKHAPISTGTGNAIAALFEEAGFPPHVFQHFVLDNEGASRVIANDKVRGVTLTGSDKAGKSVGSQAASHLKKAVVELGGNDPYVVLADADLELAANCIVDSRLRNSGQVCIAAKRIIVVEDVLDALVEKILLKASCYKMGDPMNPDTCFGPLARADLRDALHQQVLKSESLGARLLLGGKIPKRKGFYYPPTVLTHVRPGMPAFDEELFGPVIGIIAAKNEANAIQLANDSPYGLGAAVFTRNLALGEQLATNEIDSGSCFVNALVASDPRVPFGGIKCSGFGRELSREGILEFMNVKTVAVG